MCSEKMGCGFFQLVAFLSVRFSLSLVVNVYVRVYSRCGGFLSSQSFFFPHFIFTAGRADVRFFASLGFCPLRPLILYLRRTSSVVVVGSTLRLCLLDCIFGSLKERHVVPPVSCFLCGLCVLSIRSCGGLPRWWLGPLCVRASSIALLDNLEEHCVARFDSCFL